MVVRTPSTSLYLETMKISILPRCVLETENVVRVAPRIFVQAAGGNTPGPEAAGIRTGFAGFATEQLYQEYTDVGAG